MTCIITFRAPFLPSVEPPGAPLVPGGALPGRGGAGKAAAAAALGGSYSQGSSCLSGVC